MESIKERLDKLDAHIIVGIGGDSGSGKTTFSKGITEILGQDMVSSISLDDYHIEDRETRKRTGHLPLDPRYNDLELMAEHISELRSGKEIIKPIYDHSTGRFAPREVFSPTRVIIVEGLHPLYTKELRELMDFSIFVDPVRDVKWKWKMKRDVEKRGHDSSDAFNEILDREPLFKQFIDIQKIWAEIVVRIMPSRYSDDNIIRPQVKLIMRSTDMPVEHIDLNFDMSDLITNSTGYFSLEFGTDHYYGKPCNVLTVDGLMSQASLFAIRDRISDFTGIEKDESNKRKGGHVTPTEVATLIIAWRFLEKLNTILTDLERAKDNK
ncbi:MAG: phosphoribulokinase [Candidatus Thermoplasmatota archaeon]|nr:phosphoribulokinase [Candidatus Thermoplasmatota archaeon]